MTKPKSIPEYQIIESMKYCEQVQKICHPLFKKTPIDHFEYNLYYNDSHCIYFSSNPDHLKSMFTSTYIANFADIAIPINIGLNCFYLSIHNKLPPGQTLIDPNKYTGTVLQAIEHKIFHRLAFLKRGLNCFKVCKLGSSKEGSTFLHYCLNSQRSLYQFIADFEEKIKELVLHYPTDRRIIVPSFFNISTQQSQLLDSLHIKKFFDDKPSVNGVKAYALNNLSFREFECLTLMAKGYTTKMIAKKLYISHRTVEKHLANIKDKCHIHGKNQLIELWHSEAKESWMQLT